MCVTLHLAQSGYTLAPHTPPKLAFGPPFFFCSPSLLIQHICHQILAVDASSGSPVDFNLHGIADGSLCEALSASAAITGSSAINCPLCF